MRRSLPVLLLLTACSAKRADTSASYYASPDSHEESPAISFGRDAPADGGGSGHAPKPPAAYDEELAAPPPPPGDPGGTGTSASTPAAQRMVHYAGYLQLRATNPTQTLDDVIALATANGGKVENLYATAVTIRVPVAKFDAVWDQVRALGDVLDESLTTDDVTEAFFAVDLRVKTLRTTRDRLVTLLARAEDEEEKLALIREIQRVTEQLDRRPRA